MTQDTDTTILPLFDPVLVEGGEMYCHCRDHDDPHHHYYLSFDGDWVNAKSPGRIVLLLGDEALIAVFEATKELLYQAVRNVDGD